MPSASGSASFGTSVLMPRHIPRMAVIGSSDASLESAPMPSDIVFKKVLFVRATILTITAWGEFIVCSAIWHRALLMFAPAVGAKPVALGDLGNNGQATAALTQRTRSTHSPQVAAPRDQWPVWRQTRPTRTPQP